MTHLEHRFSCPVCGSASTTGVWEMCALPVFCNVLCKTRDEALAMPRGDIRLAVCTDCGFIWNAAFDPAKVTYSAQYENSLHFSETFQGYVKSLAEDLVERHNLRGKHIVEVACGKGDFLTLLCELGDNTGLGFDPGYPADTRTGDDRITILAELYGRQHAEHKADFVCCRHALEHVVDPVAFLRIVRNNMGDEHECTVFFEVPDALFTLRQLGIWDIIYEHCSYFSADALAQCFAIAGFAPDAVRTVYGGQFLCIEARPTPRGVGFKPSTSENVADLVRDAEGFGARFEQKLGEWKQQLRGFAERGDRTVVWGSGSKGVTFLNMARDVAAIEYVVDINPRKQGMYVAGTGQPIVAPEFLGGYEPDRVIVMNPIYLKEIQATAHEYGIKPVFHVA